MYSQLLKVFAFVLLCTQMKASPLPFDDANRHFGAAFIDCQDDVMVLTMKTAGIRFKCFQDMSDDSIFRMTYAEEDDSKVVSPPLEVDPKDEDLEVQLEDDEGPTLLLKKTADVDTSEEEIMLEEAYPNREFETIFYEATVDKCPDNYKFVSGTCRQIFEYPVEKVKYEGYFDANAGSVDTVKCKDGSKFDAGTGKCIVSKKAVPEYQTIQVSDCVSGTAYDPATNTCKPVEVAELRHSSTIKDTKPICEPGTIYNSEIDICLEYDPPKDFVSQPLKPAAAPVRIFEDDSEETGPSTPRCKEGTVYNADTDLCLDYEHPIPRPVQQTEQTVRKRPVLPSTLKCPPGQVYSSSIDYCMNLDGSPAGPPASK